MYYGLGNVDKWSDARFARFVDYCCADYISRLEIINMAKELQLHVEACSFR